jgi:hypothetical protein
LDVTKILKKHAELSLRSVKQDERFAAGAGRFTNGSLSIKTVRLDHRAALHFISEDELITKFRPGFSLLLLAPRTCKRSCGVSAAIPAAKSAAWQLYVITAKVV